MAAGGHLLGDVLTDFEVLRLQRRRELALVHVDHCGQTHRPVGRAGNGVLRAELSVHDEAVLVFALKVIWLS